MDHERFDNLTRVFSSIGSRREAVRALAGGTLAVALGALRLEEAAAVCASAGKKCGAGTKCCRGTECRGGRCKCTAGVACAGKCCRRGQTCQNGRCCDGRAAICQGKECGTATNACGQNFDCGTCPTGQTCRDHACCDDRATSCGNRQCGTATNACGETFECGACAGGKVCNPDIGTCRCPDNQHDCNGTCIPNSACCPGETRTCYSGPQGTAGVGICRRGTQTCRSDNTFGPCDGEVTPRAETCNNQDDDCNGKVDDGNLCGEGEVCGAGRCCRVNGEVCTHATASRCCSGQCFNFRCGPPEEV